MSTDARALKLICEFEGFLRPLADGTDRVAPYLDPVGIPTIGYGSIFRADGSRVAMEDPPISRAHAEALMDLELTRKCEPAIQRLVKVPLHPLMHGALVSFCYNCGSGALKASTLLRMVNAQRWADVPREFAKWKMAGGRTLAGLVRRRAAEAAMFMQGVEEMRRPPAANDNWLTEVLRRAA